MTFCGTARIRRDIASAAVQQTMIGTGGPGVDVALFDERTGYAA
jgi:hypothetical protein